MHQFACYRMDNGAIKKDGSLSKVAVPLLLTEKNLALKPAEESRVWSQTVAVAGRLEQLDLSDHLELLQRQRESHKR